MRSFRLKHSAEELSLIATAVSSSLALWFGVPNANRELHATTFIQLLARSLVEVVMYENEAMGAKQRCIAQRNKRAIERFLRLGGSLSARLRSHKRLLLGRETYNVPSIRFGSELLVSEPVTLVVAKHDDQPVHRLLSLLKVR